ncbi:MAG: HAMP domain-containing histidine kinase, partial [Bdellovibrionales bacterium]|nr:HAMP domain-containing histidine kinase [Bdellovibrionales bacterium]
LKKVFKKFYQVGTSTKGSGLGLYIVHSIVKLHKGDIHAFSSGFGLGTTFRITFKRND